MLYPGSIPEFRILVKKDGTQQFQLRYINSVQGYIGKWQVIPVVHEETTESIK
jgi:hypothetical protein